MWASKYGDLEHGAAAPLYPMMHENPELRWAFIRKIYSILTVQILLTVAVAAVMMKVRAISVFISTTWAGFGLYILIIILLILAIFLLYFYYKTHPVNYILLCIFTLGISLSVGMSCAFTEAALVLEAAILTAVVVVGLTLYTFWAARRGQDFEFLGPFLSVSLLVLIAFGFIQIFFPMGKIATMIYAALGAIIFCGYIIYDTDNLIKRYTYDEYIWASIVLYLDIVNLFLLILKLLRASQN